MSLKMCNYKNSVVILGLALLYPDIAGLGASVSLFLIIILCEISGTTILCLLATSQIIGNTAETRVRTRGEGTVACSLLLGQTET
jgi:hypothetical protein